MVEEVWKPVVGYEDLYEVSTLGNIRSLDRETLIYPKNKVPYTRKRKGKLLIPTIFNNGYAFVSLSKNGNDIKKSIHYIVATAFIPNLEGKTEIDHINTNRADNRVENLRWVTRVENHLNPITRVNHSAASIEIAVKRFGKSCLRGGKPNPKPRVLKSKKCAIIQLSLSYEYVARFENFREIKDMNVFSVSNIRKCCNKGMISSQGYIWLYEEDYNAGNYQIYNNLNTKACRTYSRSVMQYSRGGQLLKIWDSITEASKNTGANLSHITQCCLGRIKQCGGYMWKYNDTHQ